MAISKSIRIETNSDFEFTFRWTNRDGTLIHYLSDAIFTVRENENTDDILIEASVGGGQITLDGVDGWAYIIIPSTEMANLPYYGVAKYDILATRQSDGITNTIFTGDALLVRGVTR